MQTLDPPALGAAYTAPPRPQLRRRAGLDLFDILGDLGEFRALLGALRGRHDLAEWDKAAGRRHEVTRFYWRPARPQGRPPQRFIRIDDRGRLLLWAADGDLTVLWRILVELDILEPWSRAALLDTLELARLAEGVQR